MLTITPMSTLHYFNLPAPVLLHAVALTTVGLGLTFRVPKRRLGEGPAAPAQQESILDQLVGDKHADSSLLGGVFLGVGLAYISTSYMPQNQNQFLWASPPVRILLASLAGVKLLLGVDNPLLKRSLIGAMLWDSIGGLWVGYQLGSFSGRIPGY